MAFWRRYMVLRDKHSRACGYVRLRVSGQRVSVYASAQLPEAKYTLLLFGQGFTHKLGMLHTGGEAVYEGEAPLPPTERFWAAVMRGQSMMLLSETDGAQADWARVEGDAASRCRKKRKPARPVPTTIEEEQPPTPPRQEEQEEEKPIRVEKIEIPITIEPVVDEIEPTPQEEEPEAEQMAQAEPSETEPEEKLVEMRPERKQQERLQADTLPIDMMASSFGPQGAMQLERAPRREGTPMLNGDYAGLWEWESISIPGSGFTYLMGHAQERGKVRAVAVAVPGEYAPTPPPNLTGFSGYVDGYWVLAQNAETGERLGI